MATPDPSSTSVAAIAINSRIPQFWRDRPTLWFVQLEAVLDSSKPNDDAKYQVVIANLDKQDLEQISDILIAPPATGKFDAIKTRLISVYEESEEKRVQRLFHNLDIGDLQPSQLLRRMRDLAGKSGTPDSVLQVLWMGKLPSHVRAILSTSSGNLDTLALTADKILAHCQPAIQPIAAVSSHSERSLLDKIEQLQKRIEELTFKQERSRSRDRWSNRRSRSRSNSKSRQTDTCYYHKRFGKEARKCTQPCKFSENFSQQHS